MRIALCVLAGGFVVAACSGGSTGGGDPGVSGGGSGGESSSGGSSGSSSGAAGGSGSGSSSGSLAGSSSGTASSSGSSGSSSGSSSGGGSGGNPSNGSSSGGGSGSGSGSGSSSGSTPEDAGFACASPSDCGSGGEVCCGTIMLTGGSPPSCNSGGVAVSCTSGGSCPTTLGSSCTGQQVVRLCKQSSDCTEANYNQCCTFPGQNGSSLSFCANSLIATFANATCM